MPMEIALTTRWNAERHTSGEAMIEEILELGFTRVELGYDLRIDLVPGVKKMIDEKAVFADSVHNYCPVPIGAPRGHPELFTFASLDQHIREGAIRHTINTIHFAADIGASVVVAHAGNVDMPHLSSTLCRLQEEGEAFSPKYEKVKLKLQTKREKKKRKHWDQLMYSLERLLPVLTEYKVQLALENLPSWEAIPLEMEMEQIVQHFGSGHIRYWHDTGHGQIRQNLGFINQERWLDRLQDHLAGMHIHDVIPPIYDHVMPPRGSIEFPRYKKYATMRILRVIEPKPHADPGEITEALQYLKDVWS